jgi:hypothetical protein
VSVRNLSTVEAHAEMLSGDLHRARDVGAVPVASSGSARPRASSACRILIRRGALVVCNVGRTLGRLGAGWGGTVIEFEV